MFAPIAQNRFAAPIELSHKAADADDALARLDERLRHSPLRDGWLARTHILDAKASIGLDGDLVSLEDLVLHDAGMDIRAPTPELTRAHEVLRARRRIAAATPGWAFEASAHDILLGRVEISESEDASPDQRAAAAAPLDDEFAHIDALIARTSRFLARGGASGETQRLTAYEAWRARLEAGARLGSVAAAVDAGLAWDELRPVDNAAWLGRLVAAEVLRIRRKTQVFLCPLSLGLSSVSRAKRQSPDRNTKMAAWIDGFTQAALGGLRDHDRWLTIQRSLERQMQGRRSTSKLPSLIKLVMERPLVTSAMIALELKVSQRAAQDYAEQLGLREMTGRRRYRAWGIL